MSAKRVWIFVVSVWTTSAALLPVTQDEAYYFVWSKNLALGYFDHPALVALLGATSNLADGVFVGRLGTLICGALTLWLMTRLFSVVGITSERSRGFATLIVGTSLFGLLFGFLTTPDAPLIFCWTLALHEAAHAFKGSKRRWLTTGAAVGLGLNAKYTMAIFPFALLWALFSERREAIRTGRRPLLTTPWPYAGVAVALLVFAPNVSWNATHDWITMRFQLRHGLHMERPARVAGSLPLPVLAKKGGPEELIAAPFVDLEKSARQEELKPGALDDALKSVNRAIGYEASQIVLWGCVAPVFVWSFLSLARRRRAIEFRAVLDGTGLDPRLRSLLLASTTLPLLVCGVLSLFSKVEANWSGMYVVSAGLFLLPLALRKPRATLIAASFNAALLLLAAIHSRTFILPTRPHKDRVLLETYGYQELASVMHEEAKIYPLFADTYQIAAMSRFHQPHLLVRQWPGISRDSEFVVNPELFDLNLEDVASGFSLVTTDLPPPSLPGFVPSELMQMRSCLSTPLQIIESAMAKNHESRCRRPVHVWYLVRYSPQPNDITTL